MITFKEVIPINIGQNIRCLRLDRRLTQKELAQALNVSVAAISRWENDVCYPDITLLPVIAQLLDTSIDSLFSNSPKMHRKSYKVLCRQMQQPVLIMEPFHYLKQES